MTGCRTSDRDQSASLVGLADAHMIGRGTPLSGSFRRSVSGAFLLVMTACVGLTMTPGVALSQNSSALSQELDRLRRDIRDLQRSVYAGAAPPANAGTQAAAPSGDADAQSAAQTRVQMQSIEREMRSLTGRVEEMGFQINRLNTRLDKLVSDVDFRLKALESGGTTSQGVSQLGGQSGGQVGGQVGGQLAANNATTVITGNTPGVQGATGQPATGGLGAGQAPQGQQLLGQIPASSLNGAAPQAAATNSQTLQPTIATRPQQPVPPPAAPAAAPSPGAVTASTSQAQTITLPEGDERTRYQFAYGLLRQDLVKAEAAFKAFLDQHQDGVYAGNAMYWLGETHYARQDFRQAAAVFVDAYTNYPTSPKASASLLKLGMSLGQLGKTDAACASFGELRTKYASDDPRVLDRAAAEANRLNCS